MKIKFTLLAAGLFSLAGAFPAAASPVTEAFVSNLEANIAFLNQSSHIALHRTKTAAVRDFARGEASEQTKVASALGDVAPSSLDGLEIATGRSAAVDGAPAQTPGASLRQATNGQLPMGQTDIAQLKGLSGTSFDAAYSAKQFDALRQIEADYKSYIGNGDDPALLAMAKAELPKVTRRLELLGKI